MKTVADLVAELQKLDQTLPVGLVDPYNGFNPDIAPRAAKVDFGGIAWRFADQETIWNDEVEARMTDVVVLS